jgi:hypothetical protein
VLAVPFAFVIAIAAVSMAIPLSLRSDAERLILLGPYVVVSGRYAVAETNG